MATTIRGPKAEQIAAMGLYANLLEEANVQIGCIENILDRRAALPSPILHELSFLQLRFLCELIALGCLVLHGDIKAAGQARAIREGKLRKAWSAQQIIEELSRLHPSFYPRPCIQEKTTGGFHLTPLSDRDYLTKEDLVTLWNVAGGHLHRGHLKRLMKSSTPIQFSFPDVQPWLKKIGALLSIHFISLFEPGVVLLGLLSNRDNNNRVQVAFASTDRPSAVQPSPDAPGARKA